MSDLAIHGGDPAVSAELNERVTGHPDIDESAISQVTGALERGDVSFPVPEGEIRTLEGNLAEYLDVEHTLCTNNGTSALYSALFAIGEGTDPETALEGTEILCPSFEIWSAIAPIAAFGGTPVFCEVDPDSMVLDLDDLRAKITDRTGGILVCHMWSETCELGELRGIADEHDLPVVEDAAHAWGCEYRGEKLGTLFDIGAFSMQAGKSLPAGEGGVVVTDDDRLHDRATALGHYERVTDDHRFSEFQLTGLGYKFRMSPLCAAVANAQFETLPERVAKEAELMAAFREGLREVPHVEQIGCNVEGYEKAGHFGTAMKVDFEALDAEPERVIEALREEGIFAIREAGNGYSLNHLEPRFESSGRYWGRGELPVSERVYEQLVRLPAFRRGDEADVGCYVRGVEKVIEQFG